MNVYFRGGKIENYERLEKWDDDWTPQTAPQFRQIGAYKFKIHYVRAIDGGLIYDCINEDIEVCSECDGHGRHTCEICEGSGELECDFCEGQGTLTPPETPQEKKNKEMQERRKTEFLKNQISLDFG